MAMKEETTTELYGAELVTQKLYDRLLDLWRGMRMKHHANVAVGLSRSELGQIVGALHSLQKQPGADNPLDSAAEEACRVTSMLEALQAVHDVVAVFPSGKVVFDDAEHVKAALKKVADVLGIKTFLNE